jgi:hypothetical protein
MWGGVVAWEVEHMLYKGKALSSKPNCTKNVKYIFVGSIKEDTENYQL